MLKEKGKRPKYGIVIKASASYCHPSIKFSLPYFFLKVNLKYNKTTERIKIILLAIITGNK
jgi:hypothetical protein